MIRHLLATTALAVALGGAAWAQDTIDATDPGAEEPYIPTPAEDPGLAAEPTIDDGTEAAEGSEVMPAEDPATAADTMPAEDPATAADTMPAEDPTTAADTMPAEDPTTAAETTEPLAPVAPAEGDGTMTADPAVDPSTAPVLMPVEIADVTVEELIGANVRNLEGATLGSVDDAVLDDAGQIKSLAVSFGGFLGFGQRTVEITLDEVTLMRDEAGTVIIETMMTPETLEGRPDFEPAPDA